LRGGLHCHREIRSRYPASEAARRSRHQARVQKEGPGRRCQSNEERSPLGGSRSLSKFSQAAMVCHSAQAAEWRCL
jgi:hypothetical protein